MLENQEQIRERENHRVFKQLLGTFMQEKSEPKEEVDKIAKNIKIIPKVYYDDFAKSMKVDFKIGDKQFYKIKDLPDFYTKMLHGEPYQYSTKSNLIYQEDSFIPDSIPILKFMIKYAEIMKYSSESMESYNYYKKTYILDNIFISNIGLDDLFQTLKGKEVPFQRNNAQQTLYFSPNEIEIPFLITQLEEDKFMFEADIDIFSYEILEGKDYKYMLYSNILYRCSEKFIQGSLQILNILRKNYTNKITIDKQELTNFFAIIAPNIENKIQKQNLSKEIETKCIPKQLAVKIYLDYDEKNYIIADVRFCYGDFEFNPLLNEKILVARNIIKENEVLKQFINTGFMLEKVNARLILAEDNEIYNFLSEEIKTYMEKYEVLVTDNFKQKEIHEFKIKSLGIRVENNLLEIDLSKVCIDLTDLAQMLQKYQLKKKFYRLKDGSYIKLEDNSEMEFLDDIFTNMELEPKDIEKGVIKLPAYRMLYLDKMLKSLKNVEIQKDNTYKNMIQKLESNEQSYDIELPKGINANLRSYQKIGYKWLKTLDEYQFGGILADDMGLR